VGSSPTKEARRDAGRAPIREVRRGAGGSAPRPAGDGEEGGTRDEMQGCDSNEYRTVQLDIEMDGVRV
jgi:hypothetical protein